MESIYEHFRGDEALVAQLMEAKERAMERYTPVLTPFLNPYEVSVAKKVLGKHQGVKVECFGGITNACMERVLISREEQPTSMDDFEVEVLKIRYNDQFHTLTHRDLLGALMSLGLKRECFGDFVFDKGLCFFACDKKIAPYIQMNLTSVGKSRVACKRCDEMVEHHQQYEIKCLSIASFRLDVLVAEAYHLSRKEASQWILSKKVKVNYKEVVQTDFLCHNDFIVSVRHYGRFKINDLERMNKKGKHMVELMYYK